MDRKTQKEIEEFLGDEPTDQEAWAFHILLGLCSIGAGILIIAIFWVCMKWVWHV